MNKTIYEDMKKESIPALIITIIAIIFCVLTCVFAYKNNESLQNKETLLQFLTCLFIAIFAFYCWLYSFTYKVEISDTQVVLKSLFKKANINISDIKKYTCNRYNNSKFYQFNLLVDNKTILINIKHVEEFINILTNNNVIPN